jgi:hypothetical protein
MKLKHCLSMLLLAIVSVFRFRAEREEYANAVALHPLPDGHETVILEAVVGTRYLLLAKGTASQSAIICTASLAPLGPTPDEGAIGDKVSVALLGATMGTVSMIAVKAIAENTNVYATAAGKVTDAVVTGAYWVGKTAPGSSAAADGDIISVIPRFPRVNP